MSNKKQFLEYVLSYLEPHGPIRARAMFGGYGIYHNTLMFACIVENVLYFRVDQENRPDYKPYEAQPFIYSGGPRQIVLPYLELPEEILTNAQKLSVWIEKSKQATIRYKAAHPKKQRIVSKK